MSYQQYNIKDELKIMHLCGEICDIEKEIETLRLQIGKLNDRKLDLGVEMIKSGSARAVQKLHCSHHHQPRGAIIIE